jgi:hypothetical protein
MVYRYYDGKEGIRKNIYLKGIVGRYSLLNELGYRAKALFHQGMNRNAGAK